MISAKVAPFLRWSMATTWAVLLPSRVPALLGDLAAFLAGVVFLPLAVGLALGLPPLALFWPLGAPFFRLASLLRGGLLRRDLRALFRNGGGVFGGSRFRVRHGG